MGKKKQGFWGSGGFVKTEKPLSDRHPNDFYPTPFELCLASVRLFAEQGFNPRRVLDPGSGAGVFGEAARLYWELADIDGVELRKDARVHPAYTTWYQGDFLKSRTAPVKKSRRAVDTLILEPGYDMVIGNPPYKYAEEFVHRSLELTRPGGVVFFLFRLAFLGGQDRRQTLWAKHPCTTVYVLPKRPGFKPNTTKTDATEYAFFHWVKGAKVEPVIRFLDWEVDKDLRAEREGQLRLFPDVAPAAITELEAPHLAGF